MVELKPIRVLIGSAGRRVYLHRWFEEAFARMGLIGEVHVTDSDPQAAAYLQATHKHLMPSYDSVAYESTLLQLIDELKPDLFFSVNDYEIARLASSSLAARLGGAGVAVLGIPGARHQYVHDKYLMAEALTGVGISTPRTVLLSDVDSVKDLARSSSRLVLKDRYGSGSSGLLHVSSVQLEDAIRWATRQDGGAALELLVAQPALMGTEFGLDIITPILPDAHDLGILARRKERMRAGETDKATTVDAAPFQEIGVQLAAWLGHTGNIDVDVMVAEGGRMSVIDINPRFGGGYPFNHVAGADLPSLYVSQLTGNSGSRLEEFLKYRSGVSSSKYQEIVGNAP